MTTPLTDFIGGSGGPWEVVRMTTLAGAGLAPVSHLEPRPTSLRPAEAALGQCWALKGVISNLRYAEQAERAALAAVQKPLGRPAATCAALVPLRKSAAWWALAQDERRAIFEDASHHTQTGIRYLPAIARQLYHCRDLGEPFDFLTWFEFAPAHAAAFDELLHALRQTTEWAYVEREIDIRLVRA